MQILAKKLNEINPYPGNPRKNTQAVDAVAASIKEFGFKNPIIVDINGEIIAGHTRYLAAQKLGLEEVPCIYADDLSPEQVRAFRLADNKTAELSEWDMELLESELQEITNIDMAEFGFDEDEDFKDLTEEVEDDEFEIKPPQKPKAQKGDLFILGSHVLMCGDSTDENDVAKLMDGNEADLVVTDPPYNIAVKNSKGMTIENDDMKRDDFLMFLKKAFKTMSESLKNGGAFYIWHSSKEQMAFEEALLDNGLHVRQQLIWNKNTFILGRQDYHWKHEPCMYGWKDGAAHYFCNDRTQSTVMEEQCVEFEKMKKADLVQLCKRLFNQEQDFTTVLDAPEPARDDLHPTMKPMKLIAKLIQNSSKEKECVLDLFGGSGTTLIVCEQMKRSCRMMEYDPKFVDVIVKRWEEFTGKKAEKR